MLFAESFRKKLVARFKNHTHNSEAAISVRDVLFLSVARKIFIYYDSQREVNEIQQSNFHARV